MEDNLNAIGRVIEVNDGTAKVAFKRSKSCGDCRACVSFGTDEAVVDIDNTLDAVVGDRVEIALHSPAMVKASLIMYGIPSVALIAGVLFGSKINDLAGALIGIAAAGLSLLVVHLFEPRFRSKGEFNPKMLSIIDENNK